MKFAEYAKMYMALVGLLASGALGVSGIPAGWKVPLALVVAAAGAFAVWKIENADPPADTDSGSRRARTMSRPGTTRTTVARCCPWRTIFVTSPRSTSWLPDTTKEGPPGSSRGALRFWNSPARGPGK